jgi:chromosome segregation ATPase
VSTRENPSLDRSGINNNELSVSLQTLKSQVDELRQGVEAQATAFSALEAQIAQAQNVSIMAGDDLGRTLEAKIINFAQHAADLETLRALDAKIVSVEQQLQEHSSSLTARVDSLAGSIASTAQDLQDIADALRGAYEQVDGQLALLVDEVQKQKELLKHQAEALQSMAHVHHQVQAQFESRFSALTTTIAEQSELAKDQIAGLATLLEIQSTSIDQQFAERVKAHESIAVQLAGLAEELRSSRLERDAIQARITEFASLLHQHQSTIDNFRRSPMFRSLQSLHLISTTTSN